MTPDNRPVPTVGGVAADEWLARSVPALVPGVVAALVDHLPVYASLPPEELRRDITGVVRQSLRGFARYLREGVLPEGDDLLALRESATRRAEEGLPLGTVVDAYFFGAQHVLDEVARRAGPHEAAGLPGLCGAAFAYLRPVVGAVLTGYLHHANASGNTDRDARQALLAALLDGRPPADHTAISRPAGYLVLSIGIAPHPDETVSGVDPAVAASRKLRRLRTELHHLTRGRALTRLSSTGGLVLVPIATAPGGLTDDDWQHLRSDVDRLRRHCAAELTVGAVAADPPGVAAAARLAAEVREVATAAGRGPGVHRLPDVLLEYQLSRPGPARDQLASLLDPLAGRPELLDTLRTFFECALDRRRTGAALCVHPNTVDYRLRKITALTGLDTVPGPGTAMLHAALTARAHG